LSPRPAAWTPAAGRPVPVAASGSHQPLNSVGRLSAWLKAAAVLSVQVLDKVDGEGTRKMQIVDSNWFEPASEAARCFRLRIQKSLRSGRPDLVTRSTPNIAEAARRRWRTFARRTGR